MPHAAAAAAAAAGAVRSACSRLQLYRARSRVQSGHDVPVELHVHVLARVPVPTRSIYSTTVEYGCTAVLLSTGRILRWVCPYQARSGCGDKAGFRGAP